MALYKQAGSNVWSTRFKFRGQPIRESTGQYDRQAAQRYEDELRAKLWKQPEALKGKTWGNAVLKWANAETRSDSDLQSLGKFASYFPDRLLTAVTAEDIDAALRKFCKTSGTYTRYRARVNAVLKLSGVELKLAARKKHVAKTREWLTREQWAKLHAELPKHMRVMAEFAIATGLRQANVLGLTWSHVDLERKVAWVDATQAKGGKAIVIPLSIEAINVLKAVQGQHTVFCFTFRGKPIKEVKTAFIAACCRAGVGKVGKVEVLPSDTRTQAPSRYNGFTWHGLRHTWATWHIQNGTPLGVLQQLGGWSDIRMVMVYAHHAPGFVAQYADNTGAKT